MTTKININMDKKCVRCAKVEMSEIKGTSYKRAVSKIITAIINVEPEYVLDERYIRWGKVERDLWALEDICTPCHDMRDIKFGSPQICPKCKQYNNSGLFLPEECQYCQELRAPDDKAGK